MLRRWRRILLVCTITLSMLGSLRPGAAQHVTGGASHRIAFDAQRAFARIVKLWKDKQFEELYAAGTFASQVDISPEGFERYMGYATRSLQCCWRTMQDVKTTVDSSQHVYVQARLGFKNQEYLIIRGRHRYIARGFAEEETLTFMLRYERQQWRIDLFRILALSGVPLDLPRYPVYHRWR